MSSYTISKKLNPNKVFILQKSELEKRFDPQYYKKEYKNIVNKLKENKHNKLGNIVKFSKETWNQKDFFNNTFPYIEISEIDTLSGEIQNISNIEINDAASRAKMIVRENDIIVSTTRPNRGAIALINKEQDFSIASTGFCVIRDSEIDKDYLFAILKQNFILKQFEQRSSGGNYPAITQEELSNVIIPIAENDNKIKIKSIFQNCFKQKKNNEEKAEKLLASIDDYLLNELSITLPQKQENTLKNRMFKTSISELSGSRFDPFYHQGYFNKVELSIKNSNCKIEKLGSLLSFIESGSRPKGGATKEKSTDSVLSLGGEHVNNFCEIQIKTAKYIPKEYHQNILNTETKINDILFVKDGATTGKLGMINNVKYAKQNINEHVFLLRPTLLLNSHYLLNIINFSASQIIIKKLIAGATVTGITKDALKSLPIPVPPIEKQNEIAEHISAIRKQAKELKNQNKILMQKANEEIENLILNT